MLPPVGGIEIYRQCECQHQKLYLDFQRQKLTCMTRRVEEYRRRYSWTREGEYARKRKRIRKEKTTRADTMHVGMRKQEGTLSFFPN